MKTAAQAGWRSYAALCAVTVAAYANSLGLGLALDAKRLVTQDARVHAATAANWNMIWSTPYWFPHMQDRLYRPLTTLSFLVNYAVLRNGARPFGYHAVNLLLHLGNVLLVFALARRLVGGGAAAWFAAALWAVHPVTTESVANVAGRADLLAGACVLGGLLAYAGGTSAARRALLALLCLAGCLSKESAAVLPGVMLLWDWTAGRKPRWADYAAVVAMLGAAFWLRERVFALGPWPEMPFLDNPLRGLPFWAARLTAVKVLGKELALLVWPGNLAFDHSYNQIPAAGWRDPWVWVAAAVIAEILVLAVLRRKRDPLLFFAAGFCGLTLLPTANLVVLIGSIMAVRFLYLPAAGFAMLAAGLVFRLRNRRAAYAVAAAAVAVFAVQTAVRNPAWASDLALAQADVKNVPESFRVRGMLAGGLALEGGAEMLDAAVREAEAAWSIVEAVPAESSSDQPAEELSVLYRRKGDVVGGPESTTGRVWYDQALELAQRAADIAHVRRRLFDELQREHGRGRPVLSGYEDVYANLGILYYALGRDREALEAYREAMVEAPDRRDLYDDALLVYARAKDGAGAARVATEKLLMFGVKADVIAGMGVAYALLPDGACALTKSGDTVRVNFECAAVRRSVCAASLEMQGIFVEGRRPANAREMADAARRNGCAP